MAAWRQEHLKLSQHWLKLRSKIRCFTEPLQHSWCVWCCTVIRSMCPSGLEQHASDELSDWAAVCTDPELRGFLSSSLLWHPAPHYVEWECGRERENKGNTEKKASSWVIICTVCASQTKVNCRCTCVWPSWHVCFQQAVRVCICSLTAPEVRKAESWTAYLLCGWNSPATSVVCLPQTHCLLFPTMVHNTQCSVVAHLLNLLFICTYTARPKKVTTWI